MKCIFVISFLTLWQCIHAQSEIEVIGRVISEDDHGPLPFATVIDILSYSHGTTTGEEGEFQLKANVGIDKDVKLKVECLGYRDTVIMTNTLNEKLLLIKLTKQIYTLPEINIQESALSEKVIGIPDGQILTNKQGTPKGLIPSNAAGFSTGVFIEHKDKRAVIFKSIEYFITSKGYPETPFMIRILESNENLEPNRMYSNEMFYDVMKEPIITSGHMGWNSISLTDYRIPVPKIGFLILFTPIDGGEDYKWNENGNEWYGMVIGIYKKSKIKGLYWAIRSQGTYSFDDTPFQRNLTPAVVIRYLAN